MSICEKKIPRPENRPVFGPVRLRRSGGKDTLRLVPNVSMMAAPYMS
jgi:hypothetical protein